MKTMPNEMAARGGRARQHGGRDAEQREELLNGETSGGEAPQCGLRVVA